MNTNNESHISIDRDIYNSTNVMPIINGYDCYLANLVTTLDPTYQPNPYELIAMDVNMDGTVTAGDITHMQNRITLNIGEYPQTWNSGNNTPSKDWRFINESEVNTNSIYQISTSYPFSDNVGYDRLHVPNIPLCLEIEYDNAACPSPISDNYHGILLGDVDKSWNLGVSDLKTTQTENIYLDLEKSNVVEEDCSLLIPMGVSQKDIVKSIDFILDYNSNKLNFDGFMLGDVNDNDMRSAFNISEENQILFTSFANTPEGIENNSTTFYYAKFSILDPEEVVNADDFTFVHSFIDGQFTGSNIIGSEIRCKEIYEGEPIVSISPNPFLNDFTIELKGFEVDTEFELYFYDIAGKLIEKRTFTETIYTYERIGLPTGFYLYRIKANNEFVDAGRIMSAHH